MLISHLFKFLACSAILMTVMPSVAAADTATDTIVKSPTAADFFSRAPIDIMSQLPVNNRLDMLDYFASGSKVKVNNRLGVKVGLNSVDDKMIIYQDEDSIKTTIAVLPTSNNDTILMFVRTMPMPMSDSYISFYDSRWKPLKRAVFTGPTISDWAIDKDIISDVSTGYDIPFMLETIDYNPTDRTLTFTNALDSFYVDSSRPKQLSQLHKSLIYQWNGKKFVRKPEH